MTCTRLLAGDAAMGIYDRDWYRDSRGSGWFHDMHPVGKIMLLVLVGSIVLMFVTNRWISTQRIAMPDEQRFEQIMREHSRRMSTSTAHEAAEHGEVGRLAEILSSDPAQVKVPLRKDYLDQPLHRAAWGDQRRTADLLLRYGADVNARGDQGFTPLHCAARKGSTEVAELLLKVGADATLKDDRGQTPLDVSTTESMQDLLRQHTARR